jgi:hypothetical protein
MVTLSEANNVKFSDFVEPGESLRVTAELVKRAGPLFHLKCAGEVDQSVAVRGRLVLRTARLAETDPAAEATDSYIIHSLRQKFQLLYPAGLAPTKH